VRGVFCAGHDWLLLCTWGLALGRVVTGVGR
jgi:hypothetical protein